MATATATASDLVRRLPSRERRLRWALVLGGLALLEVLIGAGVASSHAKYAIMLVVGAAAGALVWRFPLAGSILMLFLVAGIIYPQYYVFRVGGRTVYGHEVVLIVLLLRAVIRPRRVTWGGAAGAALALFLAVLILSTMLAVSAGAVTLNNAINWSRAFYVLAFFWVVVRLAPDRHGLGVLLTGGLALGAISGIVGLALALSGNLHSVFQDSGNQVLTAGSAGSLLRVRMPGLGVGFVLLWVMLLWVTRRREPRWLWWGCLPGILLVIAVSQNRNMWVAGSVGLLLVMLVSGARTRGRLVAAIVVLIAGIAISIAAPPGAQSGPTPLQPIVKRASTILNPSEISNSASAQDREREIRVGWSVARRNLLIGIGPGVPYGLLVVNDLGNGLHTILPQLFLHNQYLYLLMITGIPGLLSFLLFVAITLHGAFIRGAPRESSMLGIGVIALMLTAAVMLSLTDGSFLVVLALAAGAIFGLRPRAGDDAPGGARRATLVAT